MESTADTSVLSVRPVREKKAQRWGRVRSLLHSVAVPNLPNIDMHFADSDTVHRSKSGLIGLQVR